jgi:hypothetical protein
MGRAPRTPTARRAARAVRRRERYLRASAARATGRSHAVDGAGFSPRDFDAPPPMVRVRKGGLRGMW